MHTGPRGQRGSRLPVSSAPVGYDGRMVTAKASMSLAVSVSRRRFAGVRLSLVVLLALLGSAGAPTRATASKVYREHLDQTLTAGGQQLDLFVPTASPRRTLLVFIHGGGFVSGEKESLGPYARFYAESGFVSATVNYRLAPDHVFPAALEDVQAAVRWLRRQTRTYGYPAPRRVVLLGLSAGGNLALMAGLADRSGVAGIVSAAGPTDLRALIEETPFEQLVVALESYLGGQDPDLASPLFRVSKGDPRVLLLHGDRDTLVPLSQAEAIEVRLRQRRVPYELRVFPGVGHELMGPNPHLLELIDELTQFLLAIDRRGR